MSQMARSRKESPIKDDSEVLRSERDVYLSTFTNQRKGSQPLTNRSERMPQLDSNLMIKGIMQQD
jgi:hypothetical protein